MNKGIPFIISAPSGAGKTTIIKQILKLFPNLYFSVSYTTRKKRENEIEGKDYRFIEEKKFKEMIKKNQFLEWAKVHGNYYGTCKKEVLKKLKEGKDVLFDVDVKGAKKIKENLKDGIFIFIIPPSLVELKNRLEKRGDLKKNEIKIRLKNAKKELKCYNIFDYIVLNDDLEKAIDLVSSIIKATKQKRDFQKKHVKELILRRVNGKN